MLLTLKGVPSFNTFLTSVNAGSDAHLPTVNAASAVFLLLAANSHVVYGVVWFARDIRARFNGLTKRGFSHRD
ncbi:MAG: hypothetical protein KA810_10240 [Pyrinomonadaceae bacterium]|nr:hypothetical protein [Pyrinomonadaceae bacterium]